MNKLKSLIRINLREQFIERSIFIEKESLELLVDSVLFGNYAFKIIYDENIPLTHFLYTYSEHYPIKDELVIFPHGFSDLVSIDGGKRYQWSKREIIKIDKDIIRNFKIKELLN